MYLLNDHDIHLVSGGIIEGDIHYGHLLDITLFAVGAYLGSSVAYFEPFMQMTLVMGPGLPGIPTYTPSALMIVGGAWLGGGLGLALSQTLQAGYQRYFAE